MKTRASQRTWIWLKACVALSFFLSYAPSVATAAERSSANYSITAEAVDRGGQRATSANYTNDGSAGLISGTSTTLSGTGVVKSGYIAQLDSDATTPSTINISGAISYCSSPNLDPVEDVTLTVTGSTSGSTLSNGSGNYTLSSLPSGGSYVVTPTKAARTPASAGINTIDAIAVQRHFLVLGTPLSGCKLTAANVNGDVRIDTIDAIAIQRFFLGYLTSIANVGKYQFNPVNRAYPGVVSNQTAQNYDTLIFGDVASTFVERPEGRSQSGADDGTDSREVPSTVAEVALPEVPADVSAHNFIVPVRTSDIEPTSRLVGFQGDFTFDERAVTFQSEPVRKAGITGGNWAVSGNVLAGKGPIRTLRVSAFSNDFRPLSGSGTLFELRLIRVNQTKQGTPLLWAAPPNHFIFIDADLNTQRPGSAAAGGVRP